MSSVIDLVGQVFNHLTVLRRDTGKYGDGKAWWVCQCSCGNLKNVNGWNLKKNHVKSCGCMKSVKHGYFDTQTYCAWEHMKHRCDNPRNKAYAHYGGRGIKYQESWKYFKNFLADVGECPGGMTLDRENVNGDYVTDNVRWVSMKIQSRNKRNNVWYLYAGERYILVDLCKKLDCNLSTISVRLCRGKTPQEAFYGREVQYAGE
jgi:hypothetical protein